ncbi:metal dependent phosphohydrolase [Caballeronia novacaledonica]|uniref:Metal dependent phosphohydrolase n=1 Tax=Caballeronia novacaledonica TaxID=1544861 RepID=A0A2U3IEA3_9BURK|nr:HD domain-containing phosphohydrolase [Caballeronia novacaledonica]SPB18559.1 metal dependent phosphohydrolase [Caballeronia novacaledonica]
MGTVSKLGLAHQALRAAVLEIANARAACLNELPARRRAAAIEMFEHGLRCGLYMGAFAKAVRDCTGLPIEVNNLVFAAVYHDIGKLCVPAELLLAPRQLTADERTIVQSHVTLGRVLARRALRVMRVPEPALRWALEVAALHHERWDGHGYAHALVGRAIPLAARMMAIVDCYDVIVTPRPYKSACSHSHACGIIEAEAGSAFDPSLVEIFLSIEHELELKSSAWCVPQEECVANVEVRQFR